MTYPTQFQSWTDHHASVSILAADPALLLEAIEEAADRAYDRVPKIDHITVTRRAFRRQFINRAYAQL